MGKKLFILVFLALLILPSAVFAQVEDTSTPTPTVRNTVKNAAKEFKSAKMEAKAELMSTKDEMKDKMMEAREEFKAKLAEIKDQKKSNIISNLDEKIKSMNERRTNEMTKRLERLTTILNNIIEKADALKSQGKDTSTLEDGIVEAKAALEEAKTAVSEQAAKDYVVDITTENALKTAASETLKEFRTDMKELHKQVVDTQVMIKKLYKDLGLLMGSSKTTPTATP